MNSANPLTKLTVESSAVSAYLSLTQGVISRMAGNSSNCKTWCVSLVSAIIVLAIDKGKKDIILIGLIPVFLFFLLDAYYLSLERDFIDIYNAFITNLHGGKQDLDKELFKLSIPVGTGRRTLATIGACFSVATIPFYILLTFAVIITNMLVK